MADHPRIRGEHVIVSFADCFQRGSSPHTRGALQVYRERHVSRSDHPRIRGEHADGVLTRMSIGGSSPHTRGAPIQEKEPWNAARIIPAYAGSTPTPTWNRRAYWDHPRIRGEHSRGFFKGDGVPGSSPHTRGARRVAAVMCRPQGIIPAYAGSTRRR